MKGKKLKLVIGEWRDIIGTSGWEKPSEVNPPVFYTLGHLLEKNKDVIKVVHTLDDKGEWSGVTAFPSGCVISITRIPS